MSKPSVVVEGLYKKFGLSLKSALKYGLIDSGRRMLGMGADDRLRAGEFWALQDINFTLEPGDALGIMGVNGSGKTTLLRILNGTYGPDAGRVTMRGRVGALIAAGAGFSPMLSGRENIHISAALLGMSPQEIKKSFDEIVHFSELGDFIDMPVRNYSSGMGIRLGFAIAAIGAPEILLVDEVLAVGDISFQKKCFEHIYALRERGTTILLVAHAPGAIWAVCNKGLSIHQGHSSGILPVEQACREYEDNNSRARAMVSAAVVSKDGLARDYNGGNRLGTGTAFVTRIEVLDEGAAPVGELPYGRTFILRCHLHIKERISKGILRIAVDAEVNKAIAIIDNYENHGQFLDLTPGDHVIDIVVRNPNLRPGVYTFTSALLHQNVGVHLFLEFNQAKLMIRNDGTRFFYADYRAAVHLGADYCDAPWSHVV